jgi:hypothetical protein
MVWTAVAVVATDFLIGVLSAVFLFAVLHRFFDAKRAPAIAPAVAVPEPVGSGLSVPPYRRTLIALHRTEQDATLLAYAGMLARQQVIGEFLVHVLPNGRLWRSRSAGASPAEIC